MKTSARIRAVLRDAAVKIQRAAEWARRGLSTKRTKRFRRQFLVAAAILFASVLAADRYVERQAESRVYDELADVPYRPVGVVLGTSRAAGTGVNRYYSARLEAAADLYARGKVAHLIVSGSNPSRYYNEPKVMKRDLIELGVPAESITADFAGVRTLDSVVRAEKVFGQHSFTVISQRFHSLRAVFLARFYGLDVVAYAAEDPPLQFRARLREYGARTKALLDVWVLNTQPKYLGDPVPIVLKATAVQTKAEQKNAVRKTRTDPLAAD